MALSLNVLFVQILFHGGGDVTEKLSDTGKLFIDLDIAGSEVDQVLCHSVHKLCRFFRFVEQSFFLAGSI